MVPHVTISKTGRAVVAGVLVTFGLSIGDPRAGAEPAPLPARMQPVQVDSDLLQNPGPEPAVLFSQTIDLGPDVPWVRVLFDKETALAPGSYIRVTSLLDGATQILDADGLADWGNGTAFFNGSVVLVQLIVGPGTRNNRVRLGELFLGEQIVAEVLGGVAEICAPLDARTAELPGDVGHDLRVSRLLPGTKPSAETRGYCTAFIIDSPPGDDKVHLTAGHCFGNVVKGTFREDFIIQYNVPLSGPNADGTPPCVIRHPDPEDQYRVVPESVRSVNEGDRLNDWAVFRTAPQVGRDRVRRTDYVRNGRVAFTLATEIPSGKFGVWVTGYGADGEPAGGNPNGNCTCNPLLVGAERTKNSVQQRDLDSAELRAAGRGKTLLFHNVDTCGGNSGSPIFLVRFRPADQHVVGIHTEPGCKAAAQNNAGTPITHLPLQAAIRDAKHQIPAVTSWGMVVTALLLLTALTVYFGRRPLETRN